ncbi:MAG TPA: wax ester/triacylglycerol synthase family O-acyltransferase [Noviherbaspirillum sp.]|uniref:wax ester/triacylglycerol synthase family O-acyltransferase n=1 Tax=Noviherbaspirillum sp. TaxID=1926288 RepID=UPI002B482C30|nr:wax ester/triacylglycerol synthase family O-acyltransferase [Noviherbaspirillum sp.]HJV85420.1 wax ester/triacylglycerol synthase family O-acyltransferase [Noviherbaspirillum sp.]
MLSEAVPVLRREKMSTVDTAWLRMDSDSNLMMIVAVLMFDEPMDTRRFRDIVQTRLLSYPRFRSKVSRDMTGGAWWEEQEVDLDYHIQHDRLRSEGKSNKVLLEQMVSGLSATPLSFARPLWQMHLIDNCVGEDGKTRQAIVVRSHHCIADGIALVGVLLSMFDSVPDRADRATPASANALDDEDNPWLSLMQPVTRSMISAINLSTSLWSKYMWMVADANKLMGRLSDMGNKASRLTLDAIKLMAMADDSRTRLKGKPVGTKHVAWSEPLPLHEIKVVGKALGGSINDVLMASVAGAIGAYLRAKGDNVPGTTDLRAMVPVNLRKAGDEHKLGNAFGLVPLVLPVGIEDPIARLSEVRRRMAELKGGYQALVAMAVLGVLGATPKQMQNEIQNYFAKKATAVMSNVPGPQTPLYMAGSQLDQIMFWVPQSGDIGMGVSILSYNGCVQFGLVTDDAIARDPHEIIRRFAPEFEKLVLLALMSEW